MLRKAGSSSLNFTELDELVDIYDVSEKLTNLAEPGASITWAREIKKLNRKILAPNWARRLARPSPANAYDMTREAPQRSLDTLQR